MMLQLVMDVRNVADVIDAFSDDYHQDFKDVRSSAITYLGLTTPDREIAEELARRLRCSLRAWGAGRRAAAPVQPYDTFVDALLDNDLHAKLQRLTSVSLADVTISNGRRAFRSPSIQWTTKSFDEVLLTTLNQLSERFFIENQNVTYPMKMLLLITGLMPALDSQVLTGLSNAGLSGFYAAAFSTPLTVDTTGGKKITRLPFLLGQCLRASEVEFRMGCALSRHAQLAQDLGRLFDVLLFMQGSAKRHVLELDYMEKDWYAVD